MRATKKTRLKRLFVFPPWFLTKELNRKIEAMLPYYYHRRLRFYFDRYGCVRCAKKAVIYCGSGLCVPCMGLINERLKRTDKQLKRRYGMNPELPSSKFLKRLTSARELLKDLRPS
jgi:hypothetical protein